jgi:hypothetical protein
VASSCEQLLVSEEGFNSMKIVTVRLRFTQPELSVPVRAVRLETVLAGSHVLA